MSEKIVTLNEEAIKGANSRTCARKRRRNAERAADGNSALMLVCARLRHVSGTQWGRKKYMNMKHLQAAFGDTPFA